MLYAHLDVKICRKDMEKFSMSNIFGFIAYTDRDPYIKKVLRDDDYWKCLDEISENWIIYAIKPPQTGDYKYPSPPPGVLCRMAPIWQEPVANKEFIKLFGLQDTSKLPCFITFHINSKGEFDQLICPLKANNEEEAFASIKRIVQIISKTEKQILPQYKNSVNVFREVSKQIGAAQFRENLPFIGEILKSIIEGAKTFF